MNPLKGTCVELVVLRFQSDSCHLLSHNGQGPAPGLSMTAVVNAAGAAIHSGEWWCFYADILCLISNPSTISHLIFCEFVFLITAAPNIFYTQFNIFSPTLYSYLSEPPPIPYPYSYPILFALTRLCGRGCRRTQCVLIDCVC